jgi:filamentous hemagglutinin
VSVGDATLKAPYNPRGVRSDFEATYGKDAIEASTVPASNAKNVKLAGQRHPESGIVFSERGCPVFDSVLEFDTIIPREIAKKKYEAGHKISASEQLDTAIQRGEIPSNKFTSEQLEAIRNHEPTIPGYRWHHHEQFARMQLIPESIHNATGHVGGMKLWFEKGGK